MKICQLSPYFYPHLGGVESHVLELSKHLQDRGHDVQVITARLEGTKKREKVEGVPVRRITPMTTKFSTPVMPALRDVLSRENYDIIHSHSPPPLTSFFGLRSAKKKDIPFVLTYHCDLEIPETFGPLIVQIYQKSIGFYTVSQADEIITTTATYGATSKAVWYRDANVIPNAVDVKRFNPSNSGEEIEKRHDLEDKDVILYVGRIVYHKGLEYLVESARYLGDNKRILIVGTGDYRKKLEEVAERHDVTDKIIFTGRVPNEELPQYYAAADIFVLPSVARLEAFGIVALEAMASGLPVVVSDIPGVREVITEGEQGLLMEPMNARDIAGKVRTLFNNPDMAKRMGKSGRERVVEKFTWEKIARDIEELYDDIIERR